MKKLIVSVFTLVCVLGSAGCSSTKTFEIEDAQKIVLISVEGKKVEITDADTIQQITDQMISIPFQKGKSSKDKNGFGPIIQWYDSNGDMVEVISVMGDQTIDYGGHYWTAVNGSIDTEGLNELLEEKQP